MSANAPHDMPGSTMFELTGKAAIVTGASRGIGKAIALSLAAQGAEVVVGYSSREDAAKQTLSEIKAAGGKGRTAHLEISDMKSIELAIAELTKELGRLDILVANAGISVDGLLLRLKEEDLDAQLAVNVKGTLACARAALRSMMRVRAGRIIFISSVVGETGNAGQTAYAATKAALLGITRSLAREYASRKITVNAVTPGYIETDMTSELTNQQRATMLSAVPLARAGTPEDVAAAVTFLASEEAAYVTGQVLRVNGGMYM